MKKKIFKFLGCLALIFSLGLFISSCGSKQYTVTFNTNGAGEIAEQIVSKDGVVEKPVDPTKDNYIFSGWYTDENFTTAWDFSNSKVSGDLTLYAKFEKINTVAEILELCGEESGYTSTERYYVRAKVVSIDNPTYGQMTISDETGDISVYGTYSADGELRYSELDDKPYAGDEVLLYGTVQNFNGNKEIKSGWIIEFKHNDDEFDESKYETMTISAARDAEKGKLIKTTGVVAQITYASGYKPSGFYLVDGTNSIYIYDSQIAPRVTIGNKVTVAGAKDYWILADEQTAADNYGYKGCCQLTSCYLLDNDKGINNWSKEWVQEKTVKEIMDTPVSENITTTIYKTTAIVSKQEGAGFTNYYFYDLDEKTGSYTYTQCNGGDFSWLDQYSGKICTVYLSVLNAKSTTSGCVYRFLPIEVEVDEDFAFDIKNAPQFVLDYYIKDNFKENKVYSADPALKLPTKVSNSFLNFDNVTLSYESDDSAVSFVLENGEYVMHVNSSLTKNVNIKITATLDSYVATFETIIKIQKPIDIEYVSVAEAINAEVGDEVVVKGVVASSLVNKDGFYLIDETGVIAVVTDIATLKELSIGDEVIIRAERDLWGNAGSPAYQVCLTDAKVELNLYGDNDYSTKTFDDSKTLAELLALNVEDVLQTTNVYVVKASVVVEDNFYYSNIYLVDGDTKMQLYTSDSKQYNWLKEYVGQELTFELALCDWNSKKEYKGCVVSATTEIGEKIINQYNFSK